MDNQQLDFPSRQCSSTPVGFGQRLPSKEQCNNITSSPTHSWPGSAWFLHIPWSEISTEATALLGYYWDQWECDGRADKDFTKWLPWTFPTPVQPMAEVYSCTMRLLLRKFGLNECTKWNKWDEWCKWPGQRQCCWRASFTAGKGVILYSSSSQPFWLAEPFLETISMAEPLRPTLCLTS
jgi:hypothetical protein